MGKSSNNKQQPRDEYHQCLGPATTRQVDPGSNSRIHDSTLHCNNSYLINPILHNPSQWLEVVFAVPWALRPSFSSEALSCCCSSSSSAESRIQHPSTNRGFSVSIPLPSLDPGARSHIGHTGRFAQLVEDSAEARFQPYHLELHGLAELRASSWVDWYSLQGHYEHLLLLHVEIRLGFLPHLHCTNRLHLPHEPARSLQSPRLRIVWLSVGILPLLVLSRSCADDCHLRQGPQ